MTKMKIVALIPARMMATRFPGKPLAPLLGLPMIEHVRRRAEMCEIFDEVIVATCDEEIRKVVEDFGGKVTMTANTHERASGRCAEALLNIEKWMGTHINFVAMIQGDEPMIRPEMLNDLVVAFLKEPALKVVNLVEKINNIAEFHNPNTVKIVHDLYGNIMYFSREPIPSNKKYSGEIPMWKQLGIILFSRDALLDFEKLPPTQLEIAESIDMNRFLEHGMKIKAVETKLKTYAVDTPQDLIEVERLMKGDDLLRKYIQ